MSAPSGTAGAIATAGAKKRPRDRKMRRDDQRPPQQQAMRARPDGGGGGGGGSSASYTFEADAKDHCETSPVAYGHIVPVLNRLASALGKPPAELKIYDPYYCAGCVPLFLLC